MKEDKSGLDRVNVKVVDKQLIGQWSLNDKVIG